jgi:predicted Co/Zn/Cd cation transporter (cation efflux family)
MSVYIGREARALDSTLLALDARGWIVTGALSLALLVSFLFAALMQRTAFHSWVPYIDPISLLGIAVAVLPVPLATVARAMREVLLLAPTKLDRQVHAIMDEVTARHGFVEYSSHVAKIGRTRFVEIHVLVKPNSPLNVSTADSIRDQVGSRLNASGPHLWLTLDFTADRAWM